jgi:hypothetical protein
MDFESSVWFHKYYLSLFQFLLCLDCKEEIATVPVGSTLAYTDIGCLNMDDCLIINNCCLSFVLFYV